MSTPLEAEIPSFARGGFRAVELWLTKVEAYLQQHTSADLLQLLESHALEPAAAAGQGGLLLSQGAERQTHWSHFQRRLDLLAELGVPILIVAADFPREPAPDHYEHAVAASQSQPRFASAPAA